MSYYFIHDRSQIARFQQLVYIDIGIGIQQICLSARKKYGASIHTSAYHFNHLILGQPHDGDELARYIQRYEVTIGAYLDDNKQNLPNECLSVYSTLNPRDSCQVIENMYDSYFKELKESSKSRLPIKFNLKNTLKSEISKCVLKDKELPFYLQVDIDTKDVDTVNQVIDWCQQRKMVVYFSTETRGGYHIIFDRRLIPNNQQSRLKLQIDKVELLTAEQLLTVPGTMQGGFPVVFADWLTDRCNNV